MPFSAEKIIIQRAVKVRKQFALTLRPEMIFLIKLERYDKWRLTKMTKPNQISKPCLWKSWILNLAQNKQSGPLPSPEK